MVERATAERMRLKRCPVLMSKAREAAAKGRASLVGWSRKDLSTCSVLSRQERRCVLAKAVGVSTDMQRVERMAMQALQVRVGERIEAVCGESCSANVGRESATVVMRGAEGALLAGQALCCI